jgi:hypothetical protein
MGATEIFRSNEVLCFSMDSVGFTGFSISSISASLRERLNSLQPLYPIQLCQIAIQRSERLVPGLARSLKNEAI